MLSPSPSNHRFQFPGLFGCDFDCLPATLSNLLKLVGEFGVVLYQILEQMKRSCIRGVDLGNLGRVRTRGYPDGGVEAFGWSSRGMTFHTNQIGMTNFYALDEASRKIFETNGNYEVICYTNNAAGDLLSITDRKNQTTRFGCDEYGRATNKCLGSA